MNMILWDIPINWFNTMKQLYIQGYWKEATILIAITILSIVAMISIGENTKAGNQ